MKSFNDFPLEIQQAIFDESGPVAAADVKDALANCAQVSRCWHALAIPHLYREIYINLKDIPRSSRRYTRSTAHKPFSLFETLTTHKHLATQVRKLHVTANSLPLEACQQQVFTQLLKTLVNLVGVISSSSLPPTYLADGWDSLVNLKTIYVEYDGGEDLDTTDVLELERHAQFYQLLLAKGNSVDEININHCMTGGLVVIKRRRSGATPSVSPQRKSPISLLPFLEALAQGGFGLDIVRFMIPAEWSKTLFQICNSVNLAACRELYLTQSDMLPSVEEWRSAAPLLIGLGTIEATLGPRHHTHRPDEFQYLVTALSQVGLASQLRKFSFDYSDVKHPQSDLTLISEAQYPKLKRLEFRLRVPACMKTSCPYPTILRSLNVSDVQTQTSRLRALSEFCIKFASIGRSDRKAAIDIDFCLCGDGIRLQMCGGEVAEIVKSRFGENWRAVMGYDETTA